MRAIALTLAVATATLSAADVAQKRRVAVFDFDNPPVQTNTVTNPWMPVMPGQTVSVRNDVGQTVADLLVTQLVRDGNCTVIERKELKRLLDEQNLGNSDRVDPTTAARLGRILGVDAIIVGSVTRYDHSDRTTGHPHNLVDSESAVRRRPLTKSRPTCRSPPVLSAPRAPKFSP